MKTRIKRLLAGVVATLVVMGLSLPFVSQPVAFAASTGGYPWTSAVCVATGKVSGTCPNYEWSYNGSSMNPSTGYYYRNCTDYAAWKLQSLGVSSSKTSGLGNAGTWDNNAAKKGLAVGTSPFAGAIAVSESGTYGHVAYVEAVSGSQITISEYNGNYDGVYGTRTGTKSQLGMSEFINFGQKTYETYGAGTGVKKAAYLGGSSLSPGQKMQANQYIESFNTRYVLLMQPDGNLVEYGNDGFKVIWHSHTSGNPGAYATFQGDGNLVVYAADGHALWNSGVRPGATRMTVQDDAHLVTYNASSKALWWSDVVIPDNAAFIGTEARGMVLIHGDQYLRSPDGRYSMKMQTDGNLVVYAPGHKALWQSNTDGNPGAYLLIQTDGNIVVYSSAGKALWYSGVRPNASYVIMQSDGNLVQYNSSNAALWNTNTDGLI